MTQLRTLSLFGLPIVNETRDRALDAIMNETRRGTAAFVNAHAVNVAHKDASFRWALQKADYLLPDGSGMALAARMKGARITENLNGTDLFLPLCRAAAARGQSIFLLGAEAGRAAAAADWARGAVPNLNIAGTHHGYFAPDETDDVIDAINAARPDIVLVALGVPLQDVWIARNRRRLDARMVMGVGALFDFYSGAVGRAPVALRQIGAEWVWRLLLEPRRLARRYLLGNVAFLARAALDRSDRRPRATVAGRRAVNVAVAAGALVALAPVCAAVAIAIRLDSPGPVLFRQTRIGKDGAPFTVLKFRTMHRDAEARRAALLADSDREGICFKKRDDPRVTRVGRILRRFSLDEVPQLLNVLRGEMAVVGPRPALPEEVAQYPADAHERLVVQPGLTGLWQIAGRASVGFAKMIDMDRAYARSRSLVLDIALMALTARAVLTGRGAV